MNLFLLLFKEVDQRLISSDLFMSFLVLLAVGLLLLLDSAVDSVQGGGVGMLLREISHLLTPLIEVSLLPLLNRLIGMQLV